MKAKLALLAGLSLLSGAVFSQPIITDKDMTYRVGEYYKAYANKKTSPVDVSNIIGKKGGPQFWDFSTGPKDDVFLYEYVDPKGTVIGSQFPKAKIAERKTTESTGDQEWLLYENVPNVGRTVYGAVSNDGTFLDSNLVFSAPVVDFPAQIKLNDTWNNLVTFTNDLDLLGDAFSIRTIITSTFTADAFGIADLPNLGFGDVLRVNQLDEIQLQLYSEDEDGNGTYNSIGSPTYTRFYYWIMPGRGIVTTISSETTGGLEGNATPPPDNFARADYLVRMFETNRKENQPCQNPGAVSDLRITVDSQGRALLKWTATDCTSQYRVEYTDTFASSAPWTVLGTTASNFMIDLDNSRAKARYYRVISVR